MLSGQPIPIFTNNKTKRLRQALFASPSKAEHSKDLEDFSIVTSLNSHKEWNDRDDCFETYDTGPQKQNFPLPQKSNSDINVGNMDDRPPSVCFSTRQSHYSLNGLGYIGNNQKGLQVPIYQHGKRESQLHHSYSIVSACPNFTSFNYKDVRFVTNFAAFSFSWSCLNYPNRKFLTIKHFLLWTPCLIVFDKCQTFNRTL